MITVYSRANCPQCTATERALNQHALPYRKVDVEQDAGALAEVLAMGFLAAPVVVVNIDGEERRWSGFRPDAIRAVAQEVAA